ncbi:MAG: outer membrane protein transport protein [Akkermansiaceae bacterium]|nr:outer membrane protein transport protein [Akkermansiaceae bacterium]
MKIKTTGLVLTALGLGFSSHVSATNGVNLIGIGPISRSLGGTGLAAPQDAVSAVFSNPAAMCISDACGAPQFDFSLTTFMPRTSATMTMGPNTFKGDSASDLYFIPALGISLPIGGEGSHWRAGFALYGISGLGVDYEKEPIGNVVPFNFTELQIMKVAPSIAYSITPDLSVGLSAHMNYASLEIGSPATMFNYKQDDADLSYGVQVGSTWKASQCLTLGLSYTTAQKNTFEGVMPGFDQFGRPTGALVDFDLESPQQAGLGIAWVGADDRLTLSCDVKWLNWSDAAGYSDFGWKDQWTFGLGMQYELIQDKLFVRAGYNYGKNPLRKTGSFNADVMSIVGFPAIVEHHAGLGIGYQINDDFVVNVSWVHAFENTMGSSVPGASVESSLSEDTIDVAFSWRF